MCLVLACLLAGCASASPAAKPTIAPPPTLPPTAAPYTPTPVPTRVPPTPTPVPPTPVPALPMRISAQLDPPTPHAGTEFILRLTVVNEGDRPARGVYVATSGPWDRWSVLEVQPTGAFGRDAAGWHIASRLELPPHESRELDVHVRADEPAQEQLTFAVREADLGELR